MMNYVVDALKKYKTVDGRARRSEYWYFILFYCIVSWLVGFISGLIGMPILAILALPLIVPAWTVSFRRMHDIGKPWWYSLIPIYSFILAIKEGDKGSNAYGKDPKNEIDEVSQIGKE